MAITNAQLEAMEDLSPSNMLRIWTQADATVAIAGESYTINGRQLTRANRPEIQKAINYWQAVVNAQTAGQDGGGNAQVQFGEAQ